MTDGERILLATLCEPIIRKADPQTAVPLSPQRIAAIWSEGLPDAAAEPERLDHHAAAD